MENLLASALPFADAVSFEFDGINVTAQHVMARSVPLMRLLAFYDQFMIGESEYTAGTLCRLKCKTVNFLTRPDPTRGSGQESCNSGRVQTNGGTSQDTLCAYVRRIYK